MAHLNQLSLPAKVAKVNTFITPTEVVTSAKIKKVFCTVLDAYREVVGDNMKAQVAAYMMVNPTNRNTKNEFNQGEVTWLEYMLVAYKYADSVIDNPAMQKKAMKLKAFVMGWILDYTDNPTPAAFNSDNELDSFYQGIADLLVYHNENKKNLFLPTEANLKSTTTVFAGMRLVDDVTQVYRAFGKRLKGATWAEVVTVAGMYFMLTCLDDPEDDAHLFCQFALLRYTEAEKILHVQRWLREQDRTMEFISEHVVAIIAHVYYGEALPAELELVPFEVVPTKNQDHLNLVGATVESTPATDIKPTSAAEYQNRRHQLANAMNLEEETVMTQETNTPTTGDTIVGKYEHDLREFAVRSDNVTPESITSFVCLALGVKPSYVIVKRIQDLTGEFPVGNNMRQYAYEMKRYLKDNELDTTNINNRATIVPRLRKALDIVLKELDNVDKTEVTNARRAVKAQEEAAAKAKEEADVKALAENDAQAKAALSALVQLNVDPVAVINKGTDIATRSMLGLSQEGIMHSSAFNIATIQVIGYTELAGTNRLSDESLARYVMSLIQAFDSRGMLPIPAHITVDPTEVIRLVKSVKPEEMVEAIQRTLSHNYVLPYNLLFALFSQVPGNKTFRDYGFITPEVESAMNHARVQATTRPSFHEPMFHDLQDSTGAQAAEEYVPQVAGGLSSMLGNIEEQLPTQNQPQEEVPVDNTLEQFKEDVFSSMREMSHSIQQLSTTIFDMQKAQQAAGPGLSPKQAETWRASRNPATGEPAGLRPADTIDCELHAINHALKNKMRELHAINNDIARLRSRGINLAAGTHHELPRDFGQLTIQELNELVPNADSLGDAVQPQQPAHGLGGQYQPFPAMAGLYTGPAYRGQPYPAPRPQGPGYGEAEFGMGMWPNRSLNR